MTPIRANDAHAVARFLDARPATPAIATSFDIASNGRSSELTGAAAVRTHVAACARAGTSRNAAVETVVRQRLDAAFGGRSGQAPESLVRQVRDHVQRDPTLNAIAQRLWNDATRHP